MTRIKICGVTNPQDAELAAALGADALGLNFYPGSKRFVSQAAVVAIVRRLPLFVDAVAVFVNEPLADAQEVTRQFGMRTLQWHGKSPPLSTVGSCRFIPAFAVADAAGLATVTEYLTACRAANRLPAAVLLDGHAPGQYGGTGQIAPWHLLAGFDPGVPVILAGGLTPDNVAEAIRTVRPYAVDVAGGVESSPGNKDPDKLRRFIDAVRSV
jgi:phosphoribosylanthranilate isomerase